MKKTVVRKRTVVCGKRISFDKGVHWIELVVPAWDQQQTVSVPITAIPQDVLRTATRFPDNRLRFYANVNLEAATPHELLIGEFESLDLVNVFKPKEEFVIV